ncbi:MAG TPA: hypothetical protein VNU45_09185, partial [Rummeliibacillus sp.]|nr:hypothetical protein [Rummeliibacillus sp.]
EKGAPFKYMEFNECGSLYEVVKVNGEWFEPDAVANLMDDEIRESLHGLYEEEQELVDAYCVAHKAKFGEEFVVN